MCVCWQVDTEYQLLVWFVNVDGESEETSYPLLLTCPLQQPWSPREMVCEETYMEVRQPARASVFAKGWLL